jgi:hypothetical protein
LFNPNWEAREPRSRMIGFLKSRSLKKAAAKRAADGSLDHPPQEAEPVSQGGREEQVIGEKGTIENALASASEVTPERYEIREHADGWSVYDRQTGATAETYGYRLAKMNRARADSLVEVLNRGEVRRQGRNG